jgi:hypothetical protein
VRVDPNRTRVTDRRVSPWGEKRQWSRSECDEDHGGSVACVDERREKEGSVYRPHGRGWRRAREKEKRARARRPTPFEAEAGETGEGWGLGFGTTWRGKMKEGSGVQRRGLARHGRGGSGLL